MNDHYQNILAPQSIFESEALYPVSYEGNYQPTELLIQILGKKIEASDFNMGSQSGIKKERYSDQALFFLNRLLKLLPESYISRKEFLKQIVRIAYSINRDFLFDDRPYGVLYLGEVHKSNRWVYQLVLNLLSRSPDFSSYFIDTNEEQKGFPTIDLLLQQGISRIFLFDDISYTGTQMKTFIEEVVNSYDLYISSHPDRKMEEPLEFVVNVAYITEVAIEELKDLEKLLNIKIVINASTQKIPTVYERLGLTHEEFMDYLFMLIDEGVDLDVASPDVVFLITDHKIPDSHSSIGVFSQEIINQTSGWIQSPYNNPDTSYYREDDLEFRAYLSRSPLLAPLKDILEISA